MAVSRINDFASLFSFEATVSESELLARQS